MKNLVWFFCLFSASVFAQNNPIVTNNVQFVSESNLSNLLNLHKQKNEQTDEVKGYRIQITSNNDRTKIYNLRSEVYRKFGDIKNYLKYDQPYYRLRIGDFKTRLEAKKYLERVIKHFPSAFIVADDVKQR